VTNRESQLPLQTDIPQPCSAAMEATMFSVWIYDHLKPHAAALKVAHPLAPGDRRGEKEERSH